MCKILTHFIACNLPVAHRSHSRVIIIKWLKTKSELQTYFEFFKHVVLEKSCQRCPAAIRTLQVESHQTVGDISDWKEFISMTKLPCAQFISICLFKKSYYLFQQRIHNGHGVLWVRNLGHCSRNSLETMNFKLRPTGHEACILRVYLQGTFILSRLFSIILLEVFTWHTG